MPRLPQVVLVILFAAAAESIGSCFMPTLEFYGIDMTGVTMNIIGAFLEGFFGLWEVLFSRNKHCVSLQGICTVVRGGFTGTFTNFPFIAYHVAEITFRHGTRFGATVMFLLVVTGILASAFGRLTARTLQPNLYTARHNSLLPYLPAVAFGAIITAHALASLDQGFIHDPYDPEWPVDDRGRWFELKELSVGVSFAVIGCLAGNALGDFVGPIWGTLACNAVSCVMIAACSVVLDLGYIPNNSLVFMKFAASFCGALSAFNSFTFETVELWLTRRRPFAVANVIISVIPALLLFICTRTFMTHGTWIPAASHFEYIKNA